MLTELKINREKNTTIALMRVLKLANKISLNWNLKISGNVLTGKH